MTEVGLVPPQDIEAEESVLGAIMLSGRAADDVVPVLGARDFYRLANAKIFHACRLVHGRNEPVDAITVSAQLAAAGVLDELGGASYVHGLAGAVTSVAHARAHAQVVRDRARRRRLIDAAHRAIELAHQAETADDAEAEALALLADAAPGGIRVVTMRDALEGWVDELRRDQKDGGIRLPWPTIARATRRIRRGEVILIGARTSVGKTFALAEIQRHVLGQRADLGTLFLTMEMPTEDIAERVAAQAVDVNPLDVGKIALAHPNPVDEIMRNDPDLERARVMSGTVSADQIAVAIRSARATGIDPGVVLVDYLGLLDWHGRANASTYERVSDSVRKLKSIALAERATLIVAAQLSREAGSGDVEPTMTAFRDSGVVEEAVDRIIALWRPNADEMPDALTAKILKNRKGRIGITADLWFSQGRRLEELTTEAA